MCSGLAARMLCGATPSVWVAGSRRPREEVDPAPELVHRRRGEAALPALERTARRASDVEGVQQHHPDAGIRRRLEHGVVQGEVALALVMDVVELADRGDPGVAHLGEGTGRYPAEGGPVERLDQLVHRFAPGPEAARPGGKALARASEATLKRVGMGVDESGKQGGARQPLGARPSQAANLLDPAIGADRDLQSRLEPVPVQVSSASSSAAHSPGSAGAPVRRASRPPAAAPLPA